MVGIEILGPPVQSRSEALPLIRQTVKHFRDARRATIQVMADLRRLQDGQVHLLYGEKDFAKWAEKTFDGLAAGNVRQLSRCGAVALELDRRGLLDLRRPEGVGTTSLRELSVIGKEHGTEKMIEVFITARDMLEPGVEVSGTAVKAAMQLLMPPAREDLPQAFDITEEDLQEDERFDSPRIAELVERIRDLAWDLPATCDELAEANEQLKRELQGQSSESDQRWIEGTR
jgi:hypothetical protein